MCISPPSEGAHVAEFLPHYPVMSGSGADPQLLTCQHRPLPATLKKTKKLDISGREQVSPLRHLHVHPVHLKCKAAADHELTIRIKAATTQQRHRPMSKVYCSVMTAVTTEERKGGGAKKQKIRKSTSDEWSSGQLPRSFEKFRRLCRFPPK